MATSVTKLDSVPARTKASPTLLETPSLVTATPGGWLVMSGEVSGGVNGGW